MFVPIDDVTAIDEKGDDDEWEPLPGPAGSTVGGVYDPIDAVWSCRLTVSEPVLKGPMVQRLKLEYHTPPSTFVFDFNLRRYNVLERVVGHSGAKTSIQAIVNALEVNKRRVDAGGRAEPAPHMVGWCRLKPVFASTE
jgi:hypothetical protein